MVKEKLEIGLDLEVRNLFAVSSVTLLLAIAFLCCTEAMARTYNTTFPLTENPISEAENWINGKTTGFDWHNVQTASRIAFGNQSTIKYSDPTALLVGAWGPNQTVEATVYSVNPTESYYQEVEIRLRSSLSAHRCTGYEINFRCLKNSKAYMEIVRWNGPWRDFTYLARYLGSQYGVANGDVVKASIVGKTITVYINGVKKGTTTDSTYGAGNPGIGFNYGVGSTNRDFGFTSFWASDTVDVRRPPKNQHILDDRATQRGSLKE